MNLHHVKLLTIIAPDNLEARLTSDVRLFGARGYTISPAVGAGLSNVRDNEWTGKNIRLETLVGQDVAYALMAHLAKDYFEKFGVIAFMSDVEVLRKERFDFR